ncbi:clusterin-like protein 1 [Denticeps clupeoides]|uniref:Clusterin n=1 Tax=Denticeps clupeoides TaxID=299321 RepID=A0AAY4A4C2_9TELE|nr:clusterin-like protein 1 [Denticeps clupeoides]
MRALVASLVLVVSAGVLHCTPEGSVKGLGAEELRRLNLEGERYVDEEVRKTLYGVQQMKEIMTKNEEKHEHLMKSLKYTNSKKSGAAQLAQEVEQKLEEAEQQCRASVGAGSWEECQPCLEDVCRTFYTSTCRRGFSGFTNRMENFFRRMSSRFSPRRTNLTTETPDQQVMRMEDAFSLLRAKVNTLLDCSYTLAARMNQRLDQALRQAFFPQGQPSQSEVVLQLADGQLDPGFVKGVGLDQVLDSFFDFGRSVVEQFGAAITQVHSDFKGALEEERKNERTAFPRFLQNRRLCRDLRRRSSECWRLQHKCESCQGTVLTECPGVQELHVELDEASEVLQASQQRYEEVLDIVQRHTDETVTWLGNMAADLDWVAELVKNNTTPENVFSIFTIAPDSGGDSMAVDVNILNSPTFTISIPGDLEVQDPAFIQYVAKEALDIYKQKVRHEDT